MSTIDKITYDILVIGRGPVGSAAAKHCCLQGLKVILVGPDEPLRSGNC